MKPVKLKTLLCHTGACVLLQSATACAPTPAGPYSAGFLAHLRSNAPDPIKDCVVAKTIEGWPSERALYAQANRRRAVRGETDVVNYAIKQVAPACRNP